MVKAWAEEPRRNRTGWKKAVKACAETMPSLDARGVNRSVRCFRADEIAGGAK